MRRIFLLAAMMCVSAFPAAAADKALAPKPVARIDSLVATETAGNLTIQAKGAVSSGGWQGAMLKIAKSNDAHTIVVQFVATPPPPDRVVVMVLLPVSAGTTIKMRKGVVSVRAESGSNEITTQILK